MSGLMTAFAGSGSLITSITVTAANGFNNTNFYYGWSDFGFTTPPPARQYVPDGAIGSATGNKSISGVPIVGVYSQSVTNNSTATAYIVAVTGDYTATPGLISTIVINGTTVSGTKTVQTFNGYTYFNFAVTSGATLLTATSTVVIS